MNYPQVFYPDLIKQIRIPHQLPKPTNKDGHSQVRDYPSVVVPTFEPYWANQPSRTTKMLLLVWLLWLIGVLILVLLGIGLKLPWLSIVFFVAAYCCGIALVYFWLTNRHLKAYLQPRVSTTTLSSNTLQEPKQESVPIRTQEYPQPIEQHQDSLIQLQQKQVQPIGSSSARVGVSEKQFFDYLRNYFDEVLWGAEFETPWEGFNYSADFLVRHHISGVGIDVEIDEPYALSSKKATHCLDSGTDQQRNQFFLERYWIVVRFSERQIVKAPLSCCKFIAFVLAEVTGDNSFLELLNSVPDLIPQPAWTTKQAKKMARQDYRLSYLPNSVHPKRKRRLRRRKAR